MEDHDGTMTSPSRNPWQYSHGVETITERPAHDSGVDRIGRV